MRIARVCESYRGYKSNFAFHVKSIAKSSKSRIKIRFWIRRKEHTLKPLSELRFAVFH